MKPLKYVLEIYRPLSLETAWMVFEADSPFMNLEVGDVINPGLWPGSKAPQKMVRIVFIEHDIFESGDTLIHKKALFTEEVETMRDLTPYLSQPL